MENQDQQKETIRLLAQHEEIIASLYEFFAQKFSDMAEYWNGLRDEEKSHAAWVKALQDKMNNGAISFVERRFLPDYISSSIADIEKEKADFQDKNEIDALQLAVSVEQGMLENKFFEVFDGDADELRTVLLALEFSTENHLKSVRERLETEKRIK